MSIHDLIRKSLGMSEEEYEQGRAAQLAYEAPDEYRALQEAKRRNEEIQRLEAYRAELKKDYPTTDTMPLSHFNLNKSISWSSSRYNERKKADVVADILKRIEAGEDGYWDFVCGTYTEYRNGSRNPKAFPYGRRYRLVIRSGIIKLVENNSKVIEFYRRS